MITHTLFISSSPLTLSFSLPWNFFLDLLDTFFFLDFISPLSLSSFPPPPSLSLHSPLSLFIPPLSLSLSSFPPPLSLSLSLFSLWGPLNIYVLSSIRGSPPHLHNWVDFRTHLPGCANHQVCSTYVSTPQDQPSGPGPGCYLLTHAQLISSCPFNLSVGQSCIHFISPSLISNYPHQYPKSRNLGFHQHPLHDTKIKPSQLALNSSPAYNQTILCTKRNAYFLCL